MKTNDTFLALYREYETKIRDMGMDPKDYETQVDELTGARLGACRYFRNYLSHKNDPGFLIVSDLQVKFLKQTIDKLTKNEDILKKHIKTVAAGTCGLKDKCSDVIKKMAKIRPDNVVVITDKGVVLASMYDVALAAVENKTSKIETIKTSSKGIIYAAPTDKMENLPIYGVIVCTKDGTKDGEVIGVYYPKR